MEQLDLFASESTTLSENKIEKSPVGQWLLNNVFKSYEDYSLQNCPYPAEVKPWSTVTVKFKNGVVSSPILAEKLGWFNDKNLKVDWHIVEYKVHKSALPS